ncbi:hypothetical protein WJX79_008098 [Trebouxia sp. C0005]
MPAGPVVTRSLHGAFAGGRRTLPGASEASGNSVRQSSSKIVCPRGCLVVRRGSRATVGGRVDRLSFDNNTPNRTLSADTKARTTSQQQLPSKLIRARRFKATGFGASAAVLGVGLGTAWVQGVPLPNLGPWSFLGSALLVPVGAVVLLLAITKDKAQVEVHKGRLYIQWGSPSTGAPLADGSIEVRPTTDGRGNGAFAAKPIPAGTYIGDYEGELLDESAYWARYPSGVSDYSIRIDQEWSIDGQSRAPDTSAFSPCHMNHSTTRHNVVRSTSRRQQKVSFFTATDIKVDEELLLDYGSTYWKTREDQQL